MDDKPLQGKKTTLDPLRTPILYADSILITSNDNGFVFDIGQGVGGSGNTIIVARIGMSREHAKKLAEMIGRQLMRQGQLFTGKKGSILN